MRTARLTDPPCPLNLTRGKPGDEKGNVIIAVLALVFYLLWLILAFGFRTLMMLRSGVLFQASAPGDDLVLSAAHPLPSPS